MGIREVRVESDPLLRKISKPVREMNDRTKCLLEDMYDTLEKEQGVGLAAPQVGILKRIFITSYNDVECTYINPEILEYKGKQVGIEGCLSIPGEWGIVKRPSYIKIKALNENMEEFVEELVDYNARIFCHEFDHLNGILYRDRAYCMEDEIEDSLSEEVTVDDIIADIEENSDENYSFLEVKKCD